jgi:hypothetical protein
MMFGWFKAAHAVSVLGELGGQKFDCQLAAQPRVFGQVNFAHAARADAVDDAIV